MSEPPAAPRLDLSGAPCAILGWAGATERQLRSVAGFYKQHGAVPFTARARVFRDMARPDGWDLEGEELAPRVRAHLRRSERPLIVHLFSNAGFWTFAALLRALTDAERARIGGVILDSAPGFPPAIDPAFYADNASKAMMPMVLRSLGRRPALTHPVLSPPVWAFMRCWYHVSGPQRRAAEASLGAVRDGGEWPLAFLYSDVDALVDAALVEAFIATLPPERVTRHRFLGSAHVLHMLTHRQVYFTRVSEFLARLG